MPVFAEAQQWHTRHYLVRIPKQLHLEDAVFTYSGYPKEQHSSSGGRCGTQSTGGSCDAEQPASQSTNRHSVATDFSPDTTQILLCCPAALPTKSKKAAALGDVETQSVGGSCGAGQPSSQSANGQSLLYGLQVSFSQHILHIPDFLASGVCLF